MRCWACYRTSENCPSSRTFNCVAGGPCGLQSRGLRDMPRLHCLGTEVHQSLPSASTGMQIVAGLEKLTTIEGGTPLPLLLLF